MADRASDAALSGGGVAARQGGGGPGAHRRRARRPGRGLFVVCSCTGYATPGLDILLARDLGMAPDTQRMFVGHMGCYAALPGLGAAGDFVAARGRPALLLCAELTSLHIQPANARVDTQQIVSHALFSDAAVAAVLVPGGRGYALREVASVTDTSTADHMTWDVTDTGFRMGLSPKVPQVLSHHVRGWSTICWPGTAGRPPKWTAGRCTRAARGSSTWWTGSWPCRRRRSRRPAPPSTSTATARLRQCC